MHHARYNLLIVTNIKQFLKRPTNALGCVNVILLRMEQMELLPNLTVYVNFAISLKMFVIRTGERKLNIRGTQKALEMTDFVCGLSWASKSFLFSFKPAEGYILFCPRLLLLFASPSTKTVPSCPGMRLQNHTWLA
jgi:hypothetical protein